MRQILSAVLVVIALAFFFPFASVSGQTGKTTEPSRDDSGQLLRALLDEVRELRVALQRANVASYRLQVTLERLRLQQSRVEVASRALEGVRSRLSDLKASRPQLDEQIKSVEDLMNTTADPNRRSQLEQQLREMKTHQSLRVRQEEQSRARESELVLEFQLEQAKLNDLNNQLDDLVRQLESP